MELYQGNDMDDGSDGAQPVSMSYEEYLDYRKTCEAQIALGVMSQKLAVVPEFKALVMEDYFTKEPARLAALMTSGRMTGKAFDGAVEDLKAIGHLRKFLTQYIQKAEFAKNELANLTEAYNAAVASGVMPADNAVQG